MDYHSANSKIQAVILYHRGKQRDIIGMLKILYYFLLWVKINKKRIYHKIYKVVSLFCGYCEGVLIFGFNSDVGLCCLLS